MANFLVRTDTVKYRTDTLKAWIARQEKHTIYGFPKLPIYIRYFTCDGRDGRIKFYEDIYEEDRYLREKYFADKSVQ
jgi:murein L,D-transpeptidase YcbB/YkuD